MIVSDLPRELLDLLISTIAEDPTNSSPIASLKACALTCKALSESARLRLYSSITIIYDLTAAPKANAIKALQDALERDVYLAAGVRSFQIHFWNVHHWHGSSVHGLTARTQGLPGVLNALQVAAVSSTQRPPQLRTIGICIFGGEFLEWDAFNGQFRTALEELCVVSTITTFCLEGIFLFDSWLLLRAMPYLRTLDLTGSELEAFPRGLPRTRAGETTCPQLEILRFKQSTVRSYHWQSEVPNRLLGSLKMLEVQPTGFPHSSMLYQDIWKNSSASLTVLKIVRTVADTESLPQWYFPDGDLTLFPQLRTFIIEIRTNFIHQCCNVIGWTSQTLLRLTDSPLETMRLDLISTNASLFVRYESGHLEPKAALVEALERLDSVLAGSAFRSLRIVDVRSLQSAKMFRVPIDEPSRIPVSVNVVDLSGCCKNASRKRGCL